MPNPTTRANPSTGQLEILHPELQLWVQGVAALLVTGGFTVNLQDAQALLLTAIANKAEFLQTSDEKLAAVRVALESINLKATDLQTQARAISINQIPTVLTSIQGTSQEVKTAATDVLASLAQFSAKIPSIGTKLKTQSVSVVIASDHQSIPVSLSAQGLLDFTACGTLLFGNIKATPGAIYAFSCTNFAAEMRWLQFFNKTSNPIAGELARKVYPVHPDDGHFVRDADFFGSTGMVFNAGISWGFSTTRLNFTAPTVPAECILEVSYS